MTVWQESLPERLTPLSRLLEKLSHSANQEIPCLLWKTKVHYYIHKNLPVEPIPSQLNPVYTLTPRFFNIHYNIIFQSVSSSNNHPIIQTSLFSKVLKKAAVQPSGGDTVCWGDNSEDVRFEVFMVVKIQVKVFWVVMLCSVVVGYQHFGGPCCLHLQGETLIPQQNTSVSNPKDLDLNWKTSENKDQQKCFQQ